MEEDIDPQHTLATADSVLPRFDWNDENKRNYLSYRLCGYGREEACRFIGKTGKTIRNWMRDDEAFRAIEQRDVFDLRKEFAKEIVALDFSRNYKLVMDHDRQVLERVRLADDNKTKIDKDDQEYLGKIRGLYTPQQMQVLESMFKGQGNEPQSWDEMLIWVRKSHAEATEASEYTDKTQRRLEEYKEGSVVKDRYERGQA